MIRANRHQIPETMGRIAQMIEGGTVLVKIDSVINWPLIIHSAKMRQVWLQQSKHQTPVAAA
jgi:hypothetical protein